MIAVFFEFTSAKPLIKVKLYNFRELEFKILKNPYLFSPSMTTFPDIDCIVKFLSIVKALFKEPL